MGGSTNCFRIDKDCQAKVYHLKDYVVMMPNNPAMINPTFSFKGQALDEEDSLHNYNNKTWIYSDGTYILPSENIHGGVLWTCEDCIDEEGVHRGFTTISKYNKHHSKCKLFRGDKLKGKRTWGDKSKMDKWNSPLGHPSISAKEKKQVKKPVVQSPAVWRSHKLTTNWFTHSCGIFSCEGKLYCSISFS